MSEPTSGYIPGIERCLSVSPIGDRCTLVRAHLGRHKAWAPDGRREWWRDPDPCGRVIELRDGRSYACTLDADHAGTHEAHAGRYTRPDFEWADNA
jgi:hypothetical protein